MFGSFDALVCLLRVHKPTWEWELKSASGVVPTYF